MATITDPTTLVVGSAATFLSTINNNFTNMTTNAANVDADIVALNNSLKTVATSGLASNLTDDTTHRMVTDEQIERWDTKLTIETESPYHIYQGTQDVTTNLQSLFTSGSWKPTKTSDLDNDSYFISAASINSSTIIYNENVTTSWVSDSSPVEAGSDFTTKWKVICADDTNACTSAMVPTVVFSQEDSMGGDWSQVCESGEGCVYLWSKASTSTHIVTPATLKAVYATLPVDVSSPCLCFSANTAGSTVALNLEYGTAVPGQNFSYSFNGYEWYSYTLATVLTLSKAGDSVYFKGDNPNGVSGPNGYYQFAMTGSIKASGNIMSLIDNGACTTLVIPVDYCFWYMFNGCTSLTTAPALPATTLTEGCYSNMFNGCTSLTTAPALPATTIANNCYYRMFYNCSALQVYTSSGTGHTCAWTIPTSSTATPTLIQDYMFYGTIGELSNPGSVFLNRTFYTQNTPVV